MLDNNLGELEQIIDQLPDSTFSYTYPGGLQVTLWHDNLWHGVITENNKLKGESRAQTFQEIYENLLYNHLYGESQQQLLDAAKKQLASQA